MSARALVIAAAVAAVAVAVVVGALLARDTGPAQAVGSAGGDRITLEGSEFRTGETVSLAQFEGKPVVVTIWASWCPGCNAEAPTLARFAKEHPEAGFLGIDFQDTKEDARAFYDRYGWTFPSVFDPDGKLAGKLGLQGTPTTIFLDAGHREAARIVGETDEAGLAAGLAKAAAAGT